MKTVNTNRLNQLWKEGVLPKIKALLDDLTESINGVDEKIDVLDTKEEIEANTDEEKMAGALAVKGMFGEINSKLNIDGGYIRFAGSGSYFAVYCKKNNRISSNLYLQTTPSAAGYKTVATLPEKARPRNIIYSTYLNDLTLQTLPVKVNPTGEIEAYFMEAGKASNVLCDFIFDI